MIRFDIYSKISKAWIIPALCLFSMTCSCSKEQEVSSLEEDSVMLFGIEEITQTKVSYDDQENGGLSATFEEGEKIGLYAFYNNFYYYYPEYASFAESVIIANQGLTLDGSGGATYSPLKSWTFSTIYGTAPHTLDAIAYYPFKEGYNPEYVQIVHTYADDSGSSGGAATLEYYYAYYDEDNEENVVNADLDFMTAHTRYSSYSSSDDFRTAMLALEKIPLAFTRQLASLNLQVTKPDDYPTDIIVTGITVYFDAYQKFEQSVDNSSTATWVEDTMTSNYSLTASTTCSSTLAETNWDDTPSEDGSNEGVDNLLEDNEMLFFPPDTEINKIVFTLTDDGEAKTYTWHPHIATFVANAHYTLSLELDPARDN